MQNNTIVELTSQGFLKVSGIDAKKLLQGQLTCDVEKITHINSCLGAHCNPKGRIISFFRLLMIHNDYYLQMPKPLLPIALNALKKYAVFYKVTLSDASQEWRQIGYQGQTPAIAQDSIIMPLADSSYEIIGPPESIKKIWDELAPKAEIITENTWKALSIAANIPAIHPETSEKFLPHELHLHLINAISFDKGCYTGQEIIARMQYLGKLKNHLYRARLTLDCPPLLGGEFADHAGHIVDFCQIDYNTFDVLYIASEPRK